MNLYDIEFDTRSLPDIRDRRYKNDVAAIAGAFRAIDDQPYACPVATVYRMSETGRTPICRVTFRGEVQPID